MMKNETKVLPPVRLEPLPRESLHCPHPLGDEHVPHSSYFLIPEVLMCRQMRITYYEFGQPGGAGQVSGHVWQ